MITIKAFFKIVFTLTCLFVFLGCDKSNDDCCPDPFDREDYTGDFEFRLISIWSAMYEPTTYDTTYYNGEIREFKLGDSSKDVVKGDDNEDNPEQKITIALSQYKIYTALLKEDGYLEANGDDNLVHSGFFKNVDTLSIHVSHIDIGHADNHTERILGIRKQ